MLIFFQTYKWPEFDVTPIYVPHAIRELSMFDPPVMPDDIENEKRRLEPIRLADHLPDHQHTRASSNVRLSTAELVNNCSLSSTVAA